MEEAPGPKNHAATAAAAGAAMTAHSDAGAAAGEVMSEVHLGCPSRHPSLYVSRFTFRRPTPGCSSSAFSLFLYMDSFPPFSLLVVECKCKSFLP